ncbi:hypothetical protein A2630_00360 [Candidatus Woesebacteria bacterium RIFCSPHIGHO2_01_FULL_44_10]|uniref:DNA-3-methyladenine glycosylase II n=1 Tax=Candidatus Woesebacteria bacterium RIFCSPLOWO2_01_FULL_44_14 TaxID=1802525 RepID=A0A1F8C182_9BACT|nr:MAG: hypothetical protein A2630_00360 [Candidatus Woesebacteria bacterium RIFCSPHIGHO2_01_FULL_44_10]OGM53739.1 MAG: hypothetical protein A3F62_03685 [Candidatus Woesebacteria bacterium RIFCSPHIGHO2_12_FULL_44_11]OGM70086.1 MAG: hypothetical protein A2975_03350 [Candidatus Woesebacteria bacterium RIFCSPLOWO2_01_FULL_44_14]
MVWKEAERFLRRDKYLGPLVKKYGHCDIGKRKEGDYFASLVREIISQQLSGASATAIRNRLIGRLGGKVTPQEVLQLTIEDLRNCGLSYAKAAYVQDLAERTLDGRLKTKILDKLPDEEVERELVAVKGIGKWTAEMFLMFTLARPDIFPADDLGIRNAMQKLTGKDMTAEKMVKFATRWTSWRTVASWYLWQSLENG